MDTRSGENIIECVSRKYRIQAPGGMIVEIESDKPLSAQLNAKLLEEENDIDEFFQHRKILGLRQMVKTRASHIKTLDTESPKIRTIKGELSPRQRLNQLVRMQGEFTRSDYEKHLFDQTKYKINKWTSYHDIDAALELHRIEIVKEREGHSGRIYRVVNKEEIEQPIYEKLLEERKLQISTLT